MSDRAQARQKETARKMRQQSDDIGLVADKLKGKLDDDETKTRFNKFLENVESGWTEYTVDPDDTPYGKPYNARPRIRLLNTDNNAG